MLAPATRADGPLPAGHPCQRCAVRYRAVCGVLGCGDLERFKALGRTLILAPGEALFHEGDPATRVFTLTRGTLKLYRLLPDGRRHVSGFLHPGDFLGIGVGHEHALSAEALEEAQLCWFPRSRFDDFVKQYATMERSLYRTAADELAAAHEQMLLLARKTASERVASFLVELAGRTAPGEAANVVVRLPMSRSDIADYLGLTKETVSRVFSRLRKGGLIRLIRTDEVELTGRERLEQVARCETAD